jgi:hypothetical protein
MTISHSVDHVRGTLLIAFTGTVSGHEFVAFANDLYGQQSELFDYECVLDLLQYEGDVGYSDINPLQKLYAVRPEGPAPSRPGFIVTHDSNFHLWAAALDEQFPGRKHYVVGSLEEAFSGLERLRASAAGP